MIGGGSDDNEPDDQPYPPPPPIAPASSPLQPTGGLGRRLLGTIRALLPAPTPPAAKAPKVGLGLLLHLRPDHPRLRPTTSPSASQEEEKDAAAAAGRGDDGACSDTAGAGPVTRHRLSDPAAPLSTMFRRRDLPKPPAQDTAGDDDQFCARASRAEKLVERQSADDTQGKDLRAAGDDDDDDDDQDQTIQPRDQTITAAASQDKHNVDAVQCQEVVVVVVKQGVIGRKSVSPHGTAVQDQDKAMVFHKGLGDSTAPLTCQKGHAHMASHANTITHRLKPSQMIHGVPLNKEIMVLKKFWNSTASASPYEKEQEIAPAICGMVLADMANIVISTIQSMSLMLSSTHQ